MVTQDQKAALNALRELIRYHRVSWSEGCGYTGNEQLVHLTIPQAQIAIRYELPIGIRCACPTGVGRPPRKPYRYITVTDTEQMTRWLSYSDMDDLPSIHAEFPRRIQQRMREYILQIMEIECPEWLPAIKPVAPLLGAQGDIYNLLCIANRTLRGVGQQEQAEQMWRLVLSSGSYFGALAIIGEYVEFGEALPQAHEGNQ